MIQNSHRPTSSMHISFWNQCSHPILKKTPPKKRLSTLLFIFWIRGWIWGLIRSAVWFWIINKINQSYNLLISNERNFYVCIILRRQSWLTSIMRLLQKSAKLFTSSKINSAKCIQLENEYGCHNYHPLPVVIDSAKGIYVKDCEGNLLSMQARPTSTIFQLTLQLTRGICILAFSTSSCNRPKNSPSLRGLFTAVCWGRLRWNWPRFSATTRCSLWTRVWRQERVR